MLKRSEDFGEPREQVIRMEGAYNRVKAAQAKNPRIQSAEMLEFHPDASEPYVLQRRLDIGGPADGSEYIQIDVLKLVNLKGKGGGAFPALPFRAVQAEVPSQYTAVLHELYA